MPKAVEKYFKVFIVQDAGAILYQTTKDRIVFTCSMNIVKIDRVLENPNIPKIE